MVYDAHLQLTEFFRVMKYEVFHDPQLCGTALALTTYGGDVPGEKDHARERSWVSLSAYARCANPILRWRGRCVSAESRAEAVSARTR